jgi:hypothetical protein
MTMCPRPMCPPDVSSSTIRPLDDASLGRCVPWTMRPLDDASLGRCVLCKMRPLDDASLGRYVPWTMRPLDDASLGRCVPWTATSKNFLWWTQLSGASWHYTSISTHNIQCMLDSVRGVVHDLVKVNIFIPPQPCKCSTLLKCHVCTMSQHHI